jgi:hypothetical protein
MEFIWSLSLDEEETYGVLQNKYEELLPTILLLHAYSILQNCVHHATPLLIAEVWPSTVMS